MEGDREQNSLGTAALLFVATLASGTISAFLGNQLTTLANPSVQTHGSPWVWMLIATYFSVGCVVTIRYWIVLGYGSFKKDSPQRRQYNRLRYELREGGRVSQTYERLMRVALSWIDRFFGDEGLIQQTVFARMIRLKEPAPQWTAQSYDRCLLVAIIYPCLVIVGAWAVSGHVGPVEAALRLPANASVFQRGMAALGLIVLLVSWVQFMRQLNSRRQAVWGLATLMSMALTFKAGNAGDTTIAIALALGFAFALGVGIVVARAQIVAFNSAGAGTAAFATTGALIIALAGSDISPDSESLHVMVNAGGVVVAFLLAFVVSLQIAIALVASRRRGRLSRFYVAWTVILTIAAFASPMFASLPSWSAAGPILLFLLLLTVVNAPFDWLTLGLTRALFRRGLEGGGWMPFAVGVIDLLVAAAVVAALSFVTLFSVQMFEQLALINGGKPIVNVSAILNALADPEQRWQPEYFWIYSMLFWTLLPSVINIALGSLSALRGIPGLNGLVAKHMPVGKAVLASDRLWMAPVLAFQTMLSGVIGLAVIAALFWALWNWEVGAFGNLLSWLQSTADANLPLELLRRIGA